MAIDKTIKQFNAVDIEKYHKGLLSNAAMHDMEKAAMDDPFLADALEGYAINGVNAGHDIAELKKRLSEKMEGGKLVMMNTAPRNSFRILRAAIMIAFIAGASLLIYQFGFNNKSEQLAKSETANTEAKKINDSSVIINPESANSNTTTTPALDTNSGKSKNDLADNQPADNSRDVAGPGGNNQVNNGPPIVSGTISTDDGFADKTKPKGEVTPSPVKRADENVDAYKAAEKAIVKTEFKKEEADKLKLINKDADKRNERGFDMEDSKNVAASRKSSEQNFYRNQQTNLFRGRVTDAENNGVPFARVINVQDNNAGTYTDPNGNFNLIYADTVLTVQVRSIGFDNTNVQLRNNVTTNQVIMQEDRKSLSEVVVSNQKPIVTNRSRAANITLEEPEPADGWESYDTYVANNLDVPEDVKTKQASSGTVEVSFEVNKNGQPINIKVEKSLCPKCDAEARRIIKEGPKWKQNATKKGKTTVTISF